MPDDLPAQWRRSYGWRDRFGTGLRFPDRRRHRRDVHSAAAARPALLQERDRALVSRLGTDNAETVLTAQKISAPEMLQIGYLTRDGAGGIAGRRSSDRLAAILAGNAPIAMRAA